MRTHAVRTLSLLAFVSGAVFVATPLLAQTDAGSASSAPGNLPVVPNAQRAADGGLTAGHPSLAGPNGSSPLEPYLVTWLLPVSGLLTAFAVIGLDRNLRRRRV
jgi:hypothetical protein